MDRLFRSSLISSATCVAIAAGLASVSVPIVSIDLALCYWLAVCVAVVSAVSDAATFRIPNGCLYPAIIAGLVLGICGTLLPDQTGVIATWLGSPGIVEAGLGFLLWFGLCAPAWAIGWIGGGDLKLCTAIGSLLGISHSLDAMFIAMLAALVLACVNLATRGAGMLLLQRAGMACMAWEATAPASTVQQMPLLRANRVPLGVPVLVGVLIYPAFSETFRSIFTL